MKAVNLCNDTDAEQDQNISFDRLRGEKHSMTFDTPFNISDSATLQVPMPELVKADNSLMWKLGSKKTITAGKSDYSSTTERVPIKVNRTRRSRASLCGTRALLQVCPSTLNIMCRSLTTPATFSRLMDF